LRKVSVSIYSLVLVFLIVIFWPDIFKFDPNFLENEEKYKEIKAEILGEGSSEEESGSESDSEDDEGTSSWCYPIPACLSVIQPFRRRRASKTALKRTSSIFAGSSI
jgi:hypothetical protein